MYTLDKFFKEKKKMPVNNKWSNHMLFDWRFGQGFEELLLNQKRLL